MLLVFKLVHDRFIEIVVRHAIVGDVNLESATGAVNASFVQPTDSQIILICIHGLGNRLAALRRIARLNPHGGAVLLAKNTGSGFASLCFELGASAVLSRRDTPAQLAPMIAILASACESTATASLN